MPKFIDLTGLRVGKLTVIERGADKEPGHPRWRCRCDCGRETLTWGTNLRNHTANSCKSCAVTGKAQNFRHGWAHKRVWRIWQAMKQRCLRPSCPGYKKYGAKGITVCARWLRFENFLEDMGQPPTEGHSLDRYPDQRGNYEPGNCRWATSEEQNNNRTDNKLIVIDGVARTAPQWARVSGVNRQTIERRIRVYGYDPKAAVFTPASHHGRRKPA